MLREIFHYPLYMIFLYYIQLFSHVQTFIQLIGSLVDAIEYVSVCGSCSNSRRVNRILSHNFLFSKQYSSQKYELLA